MNIIDSIKEVLEIEGKEILRKIDSVGSEFERAVNLIKECKGKVIITGIGKSGLIGQKIASTFSSTGTPSFFIHLAEGIHGDLGMVTKDDVLLAISYSGQSSEFQLILPAIERMGVPLIAITANKNSILSKKADVKIDISVKREACPLGLAPTASTTLTLAVGDALAVALLKLRDFKEEDFIFRHPGGSLAKKLKKVSDLMAKGEAVPIVSETARLKHIVYEISKKTLGMTAVVNEEGVLSGIITDGDLRRVLGKTTDISKIRAANIMTRKPKTIDSAALAASAVRQMQDNKITALIITDDEKHPIGVIHLHKLLDEGVF